MKIGDMMKTKIFISVLLLIFNIFPQVKVIESRSYFIQGDIEVNFSTNLGVGLSVSNSTNSYQSYNYYDSTYHTETYKSEFSNREFNLLFTASLGYCIFNGLTIEPEFDINLITDNEISISVLANLTYNFNIPKKNIYPFIKLGYGLSNYVSDYHYYYSGGSTDNSLDTKVLNAGTGIKLVYTSGSAMKLEVNYKHYSYSGSYSYGDQYSQNSTESETNIDAFTISIGYSILF